MPKVLKSVAFALVLLAAVASAAMVVASKSYALLPGDSASGHGTLSQGSADGPVKRQFSFSARTHADGTVTGHAVLINPLFEGENGNAYQLHVDISCMYVVGNIAVFGGTTKRTNDPNLVDAVFFSVQDEGEPGDEDKISSVFFWDDDPTTTGDPQACLLTVPLAFPLHTIESGNIQVRSSAL